MRLCVVDGDGICRLAIEADGDVSDVLAEGYYVAPDHDGNIGDRWSGNGWIKPLAFLTDTALDGVPTAPTPSTGDPPTGRIATDIYVEERISALLGSIFVSADYYEGDFDGSSSTFTPDLYEGDFDGVGATFAYDIDEGTYA